MMFNKIRRWRPILQLIQTIAIVFFVVLFSAKWIFGDGEFQEFKVGIGKIGSISDGRRVVFAGAPKLDAPSPGNDAVAPSKAIVGENHGVEKVKSKPPIYCIESSRDVDRIDKNTIGLSLPAPFKEAGLNAANEISIRPSNARANAIQLMRDMEFDNCMKFASNQITPKEYNTRQKDIRDKILMIVALEILAPKDSKSIEEFGKILPQIRSVFTSNSDDQAVKSSN